MNRYNMYTKNLKKYKVYIIFFSSNILEKGDGN